MYSSIYFISMYYHSLNISQAHSTHTHTYHQNHLHHQNQGWLSCSSWTANKLYLHKIIRLSIMNAYQYLLWLGQKYIWERNECFSASRKIIEAYFVDEWRKDLFWPLRNTEQPQLFTVSSLCFQSLRGLTGSWVLWHTNNVMEPAFESQMYAYLLNFTFSGIVFIAWNCDGSIYSVEIGKCYECGIKSHLLNIDQHTTRHNPRSFS